LVFGFRSLLLFFPLLDTESGQGPDFILALHTSVITLS
jgi:hypothetical protein